MLNMCHSQHFAEILKKHGAKNVVCCDVHDKLLEKAAYRFNEVFISYLLIGDNTKTAFAIAKGYI